MGQRAGGAVRVRWSCGEHQNLLGECREGGRLLCGLELQRRSRKGAGWGAESAADLPCQGTQGLGDNQCQEVADESQEKGRRL